MPIWPKIGMTMNAGCLSNRTLDYKAETYNSPERETNRESIESFNSSLWRG